MIDDDQTALVCILVTEGHEPPVADSTPGVCQFCDRAVWLSPLGLEFAAANDPTVVMCVRCMIEQTEEGDASFEGFVPGTAELALTEYGVPLERTEAITEFVKHLMQTRSPLIEELLGE